MVEIIKALNLTPEQEALVDLHSFLNVLNVLSAEMDLLAFYLDRPEPLKQGISIVHGFAQALQDPFQARLWVQDVDAIHREIQQAVATAVAGPPPTPDAQACLDNIEAVMVIFKTRVRELTARAGVPMIWQWHDLELLREDLAILFQVMQQKSNGGFGIKHNIAGQKERDYLVKFDITSQDGDQIFIPAVFNDVIRDLMANARKYTPPGGRILSGLDDDGQRIRFVVEDTGVGIPPGQIEDVVRLGFRADNVQNRRTYGGGFGLTKAYWVTQRLQGRMWIESRLNEGTRIEIQFPRLPSG
ncbi:ATP-binding protein [Ectothiorhodospira lacustris]|uniref:ATP-binding protein n=1 Tax=Ectothiorhodospira lacustris TaxID=2899127 RepID=UPI001EE78B1D|nr:ATP-binding protein [Ectothiorhodospira lacustris]MCG5509966.1 ATP-binding protein [Ectothiorhodospira lacustris]MCG5521712.1 ATP-binding protein [Ectothiorhodospira lacustris]